MVSQNIQFIGPPCRSMAINVISIQQLRLQGK